MRQILGVTALLLPLSIGPAFAQEAETPAEGAEAPSSEETIMREQAANELRVEWISGTMVKSPEGERIGEINDLILDSETGKLTAAILGVGGFLGIGEKPIAVNWDQLQIDYDANEITMNLTRDEADAAPEYVFRDQELPPAPAVGETGMGTTGTSMGAADTSTVPSDGN